MVSFNRRVIPTDPPRPGGNLAENITMADEKRESICKKVYIDPAADAGESSKPSPTTEALEFRFSNGEVVRVTLDEIGPSCRDACSWHGVSQKLGDSYADKKGTPIDERIESFETVLERLQSDDWVRPGEGPGTRPSLVADAVRAALIADGEEVSDERYAAIREKVKGAENRKGALANVKIKAHYERLALERQAARSAAAMEAAEASEDVGLGDF